MKTKWDTIKNFKIEMASENGIWLKGKALNGRTILKHITSVHLKTMLCDKEIY